jgi:predicted metal-dependent HD superfamily phosphohydrolase
MADLRDGRTDNLGHLVETEAVFFAVALYPVTNLAGRANIPATVPQLVDDFV